MQETQNLSIQLKMRMVGIGKVYHTNLAESLSFFWLVTKYLFSKGLVSWLHQKLPGKIDRYLFRKAFPIKFGSFRLLLHKLGVGDPRMASVVYQRRENNGKLCQWVRSDSECVRT